MKFEMNWEIGVLINSYTDEKNQTNSNDWYVLEALEDVYSKAIELTCRENCGLIMPMDMAIEWVDSGFIVDYDGMGYALDSDGNRIKAICCDVDFLEECKKDGAVFMAWYNK